MFIHFPEIHLPVEGRENIPLPAMYTIRQRYDATHLTDVAGHLRRQLAENVPEKERLAGKSICLTVGSRGIPHLALLVRTICDVLKEWKARPFIVPAMGSHGGATAEGQKAILAGYNITEESIGVPVISSMEVVRYGELDGIPLYCDKYAYAADGIVVFNKVKPHTDFRGRHESGLAKMVAIGMAKHKGAACFHSFGVDRFADLIPRACELFLATGKLAFGVGVVQNAYDDICHIAVCTAENFLTTDARLQALAKEKIPRFKFKDCDVLIIDEIGKNISGFGFDPNIVGRNSSGNFPGVLNLKRLFIRGLTPESHHNATGLGCADITTRRCLNDVDWVHTWINVLTAGAPAGGRIPLYAENDKEALLIALRTCPGIDYASARVARIKNTLCMDVIQVSEALYQDIKDRDDVEYISGPAPLQFDDDDNLL
ncbi:MAG: hypothetical protein GX167_00190 [Firmicutes bacterium]|jgi:hypothetical protein|nr:hypothetical protein [Bacillota bacterium]